ncbi:putative lipoprotein signal peptide [Candidatus Rhodobacter oscarellae]|uniref:Putative lipoprotein signal peptide n=1 Tax=Candidatus Rhodobacter oscarellae TaxID=1675527 RepID=A0A0J9EE47_9RHOB|nr:dienelactone hydrolase [Candidatus Rhodobacter lobularis]KMW59999.1 putative lipoprotein signal peptide [Candidatus Rhodobacter lobularis]
MTLTIPTLAMPAAAQNRIDGQAPDAPELAAYGDHAIGVRTQTFTDPDRVNVLAVSNDQPKPDPMPVYDRDLTVEIWYPAADGAEGTRTLTANLRDPAIQVELQGQAMRDADVAEGGPWPLVIVSHGYPGNRYLMSHLAENIASKGYVVASIDHRDSTYADQAAFGSTLVNRSLDQLFVLDQMAGLAGAFTGKINANTSAIVGYSMGGYGATITAGGGVTEEAVALGWGAPHGLLGVHLSGSDSHNALPDPRIKTAVAFAPWGRERGFWSAETLAGVQIPMLYVVGSVDDVSGYEAGVRQMWQESTGVDRALLTYDNANHNAGAPMPAPAESYAFSEALGFAPYGHYADAVWDSVRMNNIAQHFVTAWLDLYLKADESRGAYLDLIPHSNDGVWSTEQDGTPKADHTHWAGFPNRSAKGLRFEWLRAGK